MSADLWEGATEVHLTAACTPGAVNRPPRGMVLHIAQGSYGGTISWQQNPANEVSSYLVVAKDGRCAQCVSFADKAWTESAGNRDWIGVEFEGSVPDALSPQQVEVAARFYAYGVNRWGWPLAATDDPTNGHGLGWHGMGGTAWGGHFGCPGPNIVAQRPAILARAAALVGGADPAPTGGFLMALNDAQQAELYDKTVAVFNYLSNLSITGSLNTIDAHVTNDAAAIQKNVNDQASAIKATIEAAKAEVESHLAAAGSGVSDADVERISTAVANALAARLAS